MSAENAQLMAKIAALAARVNLQKQKKDVSSNQSINYHHTHRPRTYPGFRSVGVSHTSSCGRISKPHISYRNKSLVICSTSSKSSSPPPSNSSWANPSYSTIKDPSFTGTTPWMTKRDQNTQILNASTHVQENEQHSPDMCESSKQLLAERDLHENTMMNKCFNAQSTPVDPQTERQYRQVNPTSSQFHLDKRNNMLVCGSSSLGTSSQPTPKHRATLSNVSFPRSHGRNLYRAQLVHNLQNRNSLKSSEPCAKFSTTGVCSRGSRCRYIHDASKVAICKDFLNNRDCVAGDACNYSHEANAHRVPLCLHFVRGNCTKENCRYSHAKIDANAPVCTSFANLGYCDSGPFCTERHVVECPNYTNTGNCSEARCRLPHIDRAGQIRKAAASVNCSDDSKRSPIDLISPGHSDDADEDGDDDHEVQELEESKEESFDMSSDIVEEEFIAHKSSLLSPRLDEDTGYELTTQQDFIRL